MLDRLATLDKNFHYQVPAPDGKSWYLLVEGQTPVVISAPHACMHTRDGVDKMQEEYTGAIASYLAEDCGCHAIYTCYQTPEDPNWQIDSEYKAALKALVSDCDVRFIIDLHGMRNIYHMGVALGTINSVACDPALVLPHFVRAGFNHVVAEDLNANAENTWRNLVVDHPKFTGGIVNQTITRYASQQLGIPAVQVELSSQTRVVESLATEDWPLDYYGNPTAIRASVTALRNLIQTFA